MYSKQFFTSLMETQYLTTIALLIGLVGFKYLNIPLSDNFKNEEALLKDLGL
jgi:hypothetical protein